MKNFNLFSNKHFRFVAVLCLLLSLCSSRSWGALSSPSSCTFSAAGGSTTLPDDNSDVTWTASTAPSNFEGTGTARGLQWTGATVNATGGLTLTCSSYAGLTITQIAVVWSRNNSAGATVSAKVGGASFGSADTNTATTSKRTATFTGSASGTITINATSTASGNSFYIKSITVTYTTGSTKTLVYDANGATGGSVPTDATAYNVGDKATVKGNTGSLYKIGHTFAGWTENSAGTGTVYASGDKFTIASSGNKLYAKWTNTYAGDEFTLVEDLSDLGNGSKIVIIGTDAGGTNFYALKTTQQTAYRDRVASGTSEFTMSNSNKTCTLGASTSVQVITLEDLETPVSNTYQFNVENGYLYASSSSANEVKTQTTNNANGHWQIGLDAGVFTITAQGTNTRNVLSHNNSASRFACYTGNQQPTYIYVKDEGTKYAITWANGGHGTAPTSPTNASKVTLPELSESGWQHTGWIADQAVTNVSTSSSITAGTLITNGTRVQLGAATTFTAQWKQICATPTFSVSAGTYNAAQTVSISCTTPSGCTIRYTTDGSTPTSSSGTVYSSAITVSVSQTINAIAYKDGCVDSEVASAAYTLKCATPTFDPAAGTKSGAQSVTISCASEGATIYYTTDNTTPSTESTEYSGAITVSESETIKAIAVIDGWTNSDVASAAYTINYSVTWKVNGETWTSGVSSSNNNANWNTKITAMPTAPTPGDACGDKFMGWTTTNIGSTGLDKTDDAAAITALSLFTDVAGSPAITEATTFYAVFADYAEEGE